MTGPGVPALEAVRGALAFDGGHLQRSILTASLAGRSGDTAPCPKRPEHAQRDLWLGRKGLMDVRELAALGTVADPRFAHGVAEWSGEFLLEPETPRASGAVAGAPRCRCSRASRAACPSL